MSCKHKLWRAVVIILIIGVSFIACEDEFFQDGLPFLYDAGGGGNNPPANITIPNSVFHQQLS